MGDFLQKFSVHRFQVRQICCEFPDNPPDLIITIISFQENPRHTRFGEYLEHVCKPDE